MLASERVSDVLVDMVAMKHGLLQEFFIIIFAFCHIDSPWNSNSSGTQRSVPTINSLY